MTPPMNHAEAARRSSPASKPYSRNDRGDPLVVDGRVGVDPVALRIDGQGEDLGQVRPFQQHLLPRHRVRSADRAPSRSTETARAYCRRSSAGFASSSFVGQLSTTVRSRSADAKSSTVCVARIIAALRFRQVLSASCTYARSVGCWMKRQASSITQSFRVARLGGILDPRRRRGGARRTAAARAAPDTRASPRSRRPAAARRSACRRRCRRGSA